MDAALITPLAGPPFIGIILNWGLFGALSVQVYIYNQVFSNDRLFLKLLVYIIYTFETAQTFLLTRAAWKWLVLGFGKMEMLNKISEENWISVCVIGGMVSFMVQIFYIYRLRMFSKNCHIAGAIFTMSICSYGGALATGIAAAKSEVFSELLDHKLRVYVLAGIWLGGASVCDAVIAFSMCYYLWKRGRSVQFTSTGRIISHLARLTVETGTLTASMSIFSLALFYIPGLKEAWEVPIATTAKLYSTTLLAVLNSRMIFPIVSDNMGAWECKDSAMPSPNDIIKSSDRIRFKIMTTSDALMENQSRDKTGADSA